VGEEGLLRSSIIARLKLRERNYGSVGRGGAECAPGTDFCKSGKKPKFDCQFLTGRKKSDKKLVCFRG